MLRSSWIGWLTSVASTPASFCASSTFSIVIGQRPCQNGAACCSGVCTCVWKSRIMRRPCDGDAILGDFLACSVSFLDARRLDDRPPFVDLGFLQRGERFRRELIGRWHFEGEIGDPLPQLRIGEGLNGSRI